MPDYFGLKKLEKDLNKSLKFDIIPDEPKIKRKFAKPKPKYTHQAKPDYSREINEAKKLAKSTGASFSKVINKIKNRKIIKLEKEAIKAQQKANELAHKIKTLQAREDALNDVARYQKELDILENEIKKSKDQSD